MSAKRNSRLPRSSASDWRSALWRCFSPSFSAFGSGGRSARSSLCPSLCGSVFFSNPASIAANLPQRFEPSPGPDKNPPRRKAKRVLSGSARAARRPHDQRDHEQCEEDEEQDLRDPGRCACDTSEAEEGGDEGDNQKCDSPAKHDVSFRGSFSLGAGTHLAPPGSAGTSRPLERLTEWKGVSHDQLSTKGRRRRQRGTPAQPSRRSIGPGWRSSGSR